MLLDILMGVVIVATLLNILASFRLGTAIIRAVYALAETNAALGMAYNNMIAAAKGGDLQEATRPTVAQETTAPADEHIFKPWVEQAFPDDKLIAHFNCRGCSRDELACTHCGHGPECPVILNGNGDTSGPPAGDRGAD